MQYSKLVFFSLILFMVSCKSEKAQTTANASESESVSEVVDIETFSKMINPDIQLIDVRTPEEFAAGYISNASNINYRADDFEKQIQKLDKSKTVLVYCKSGGRSAKSAAIFQENGFKEVYDLKGGITAWINVEKPISK